MKAIIAGVNKEIAEGTTIAKLIVDEKVENAEYVTTPESGIVSYRVDGLESILTTEDFNKFDKDFLENLNLKT